MNFPRKRRTPNEVVGRRRPVSTKPDKNRVFSYYANRSVNDTNVGRSTQQEAVPLRRHGRWQAFRHRIPLLISSIIIVVTIVSQLGLSADPKVVVVSSGAGDKLFLHSVTTYQQEAANLFAKSFGNRNKLTVNATGISEALKAQFPELSDVSVALPVLGNQPIVYIQPFEPSFILEASNGKFVLDSTGRALADANSLPQLTSSHLPSIIDESGLQPRLGSVVLPSNNVAFMRTVITQLSAKGFGIQRIVLPAAASEVDVYVSGQPYFVKFDMQDQNGALQQVGTFVAVAQDLGSKGTTPTQYVDVRIDGRAYYK